MPSKTAVNSLFNNLWCYLVIVVLMEKLAFSNKQFQGFIISISSYKNCKLKVKLQWVGARKRKKRAFFVPFILSERNFFNICVLSQCILYWILIQKFRSQACNFIKKDFLAQVFSCEFAKFLRTPFFIEHLRWLLLKRLYKTVDPTLAASL